VLAPRAPVSLRSGLLGIRGKKSVYSIGDLKAVASVARLCTGLRTFIVLKVLAQVLPDGEPRQISIRFPRCGLERGGKIDRLAVGKIKTKKNALLRPNRSFENRLDQRDRFSSRRRTIGEWSVGSSPSMRDPDRIRTAPYAA